MCLCHHLLGKHEKIILFIFNSLPLPDGFSREFLRGAESRGNTRPALDSCTFTRRLCKAVRAELTNRVSR